MPKPSILSVESARALFPGKYVELDDGVSAEVFELGVVHLQSFSDKLVAVFTAVFETEGFGNGSVSDSDAEKLGAKLLGKLVPALLKDGLDLLDNCVTVEVKRGEKTHQIPLLALPHHYLPDIAEAWVNVSFGDSGKRQAWVQMVERVIQATTGEKVSISGMLSRLSSSPDSEPSTTSST